MLIILASSLTKIAEFQAIDIAEVSFFYFILIFDSGRNDDYHFIYLLIFLTSTAMKIGYNYFSFN